MPTILAHLFGSSQAAGSKVPQHVMLVGEDGGQVFPLAAGAVWSVSHVPAANTQATISRAAAGAGIRNVCTGLTIVLAGGTAAPAAVNMTVNLIDGALGGTTYLWRVTLSLPAVAGAVNGIARSGLWLPGTANTAMTLEFSAAGGANTIQSVSLEGTTVTA